MQTRQPRLAGKVAVVTGASRGLGQLCALAFGAEGAHVAVVGRTATESPKRLPGSVHQTAAAVAEFTTGSALPLVCDVTDRAAVQTMVEAVLDRWGRIDVLVNNAAYVLAEGESATRLPVRLFEQMLRVNVLGAFQVIGAVLRAMRARRCGNIINVSGRSRTRGSPLESTKAAIETLTIGLADELRPEGIVVNCVRPAGFIETPGAMLNVGPSDFVPPDTYLEAVVRLAMQTVDTYTGQIRTDEEVVRDLIDGPRPSDNAIVLQEQDNR
jgi:citronellol/citronellal dehydrogenase